MTAGRGRLREAAFVAVGSMLAAVAFTWPLALHVQTRAHDRQDALFQAWTLDWVQYAVTHGKSLYDANIFAPQKTTLAFSDTLLGIAIPTLPLRWLGTSPIGVLNVSLILGFATSAAAGYLFVRLATGSRVAAAVGGAVYAFGPFGAVATSHLHVAVRPGVPLAAAAAWWLAERSLGRRSLVPPAVALVAIIGWQGTVSFYPATYAVCAAFVVFVARLRDRRGVVAAAFSIATCGGVLALLAIPNLEIAARDPSYQFGLDAFGALGVNFFRTYSGNVIWGSILGGGGDSGLRGGMFPGAIALALGAIGVVIAWRSAGRVRTIVITAVALTLVGAVMAIGTASTGIRQFAPYRLLYEIGPPFSALRATARAWMIGLVGLSLLAGLGAAAVIGSLREWLSSRSPRVVLSSTVMAVLLFIVLILAEGFQPWPSQSKIRVSAVDAELARRPDDGGVVYLPMNATDEIDLSFQLQPANLYGATEHHRSILNGYSGFVPRSYLRISRQLAELPEAEAVAELRRLGVRYVVVHPDVTGGRWAALRFPESAQPLRFLGRFGPDLLYAVTPIRA